MGEMSTAPMESELARLQSQEAPLDEQANNGARNETAMRSKQQKQTDASPYTTSAYCSHHALCFLPCFRIGSHANAILRIAVAALHNLANERPKLFDRIRPPPIALQTVDDHRPRELRSPYGRISGVPSQAGCPMPMVCVWERVGRPLLEGVHPRGRSLCSNKDGFHFQAHNTKQKLLPSCHPLSKAQVNLIQVRRVEAASDIAGALQWLKSQRYKIHQAQVETW